MKRGISHWFLVIGGAALVGVALGADFGVDQGAVKAKKASKAQSGTLGEYPALTNAIHELPKTKDWAVVADVLLRLYNAGTLSAEVGKPEKDKAIKAVK